MKHDLKVPFIARFVRFRPQTYNNHISMRVELYGCEGKFYDNTDIFYIHSSKSVIGQYFLLLTGYQVLLWNKPITSRPYNSVLRPV